MNLKVFRFTHRTAPVQQGPLCCFEVKSEQEGGAERCQGNRMPKARFKTNQLNIVINFSSSLYLPCLAESKDVAMVRAPPIPARVLLDKVFFRENPS